MLIESLRPFLRGLSEALYSETGLVLKPGGIYEWKSGRRGWLMSALASCSSPYATIIHNFWGQEARYTLVEIYSSGMTTPNDEYNWISVYDTANNIYTALYAPRPYKYFRENSRIAIYNPTPNEIRLHAAVFHYLEIMDEEEFMRSLREILGRAG